MDNTIKMSVLSSGNIVVKSPYHPQFVEMARLCGGKWNPADCTWTFDGRDEQRVKEMLTTIYGTFGEQTDFVDIRLEIDGMCSNPLFAAGRKIAERNSRDENVTLGNGVVVISGRFPSSAGSVKNPKLLNSTDGIVVLEVRDVPVAVVPPGATVVSCAPSTAQGIENEIAALKRKIAQLEDTLLALESSTAQS